MLAWIAQRRGVPARRANRAVREACRAATNVQVEEMAEHLAREINGLGQQSARELLAEIGLVLSVMGVGDDVDD